MTLGWVYRLDDLPGCVLVGGLVWRLVRLPVVISTQ
jgi:hypothetical protein